MTTIYTLELEKGKYYVGRSNKPNKRILNHFNENGSEWTKLYKPIRIISQIKGDEFDEEKYTLIAMDKYGVDNVRGGSYCKTTISQYEKEKAQQTINSIMDKCYKCGEKGHFSKECKKNSDNGKRRTEHNSYDSDDKSDNDDDENAIVEAIVEVKNLCKIIWSEYLCNLYK